MKSNKSTIIWVAAIILVLGGLFAWSKLNDPNKALKKAWAAVDVGCLPSHTNAAQHIHSHLTIIIDRENYPVPANIGIVNGCMAEIHTHDATGVIHLETIKANKTFTLGQFFAVWNQPLEKEGYVLKATADKKFLENPKDLILKDKQEIVLEYTKTN
jgi:hypothetical protein